MGLCVWGLECVFGWATRRYAGVGGYVLGGEFMVPFGSLVWQRMG